MYFHNYRLPDLTNRVQLSNLHVGKSRVDLLFKWNTESHIDTEVLRVEGNLNVQVEGQGDGAKRWKRRLTAR